MENGNHYKVQTVRLTDLLREHDAPEHIEYLSIDIEGAEWEVVKDTFREPTYTFGLITVEHNYRIERKKILRLLRKRGYSRILVEESKWDDWFIRNEILERILNGH